jgi:uncharacterized protein YndB with AHSA1/START domain
MWMTRWIRQPADKVFQAWTTPAMLEAWLASTDGGAVEATVDLKPSGAFTISENETGRTVVHHGTYRAVWPPHTLVYAWQAPSYFDGEATVTVSFTPLEDETLLTVEVSEPAWPSTQPYWEHVLRQLQRVMA